MVALTKINVGIIADDNEQQHIIRSALLTLGLKVRVATSPKQLDEKWVSSGDIDLWVIDLIQQDKWDGFIDRILAESPATLMFSDGNAPPTYSGKYPRWQKRLLKKISDLLDLDMVELPKEVVEARAREIQENLKSIIQTSTEKLNANNKAFEKENGKESAKEKAWASRTSGKSPLAQNVWVLGASLGGPAAVKIFLDSLEPGLPVAFILAQHIDEGFQALLGQVLGRNNDFELVKEFNRILLKHGQVLIAPADYAIRIDVTRHVVTTKSEWSGPYSPSINEVMKVVAEQYGSRSGAIIFSGMGNDGAESAEYMTSVGGKIWAQTEETCACSSQPDSVRQTGSVSYNGSPQQLAAKLMNTLRGV